MTIKSLANILGNAVSKESKSLLAADISIRGSWEQTKEDRDFQKKALPAETDFLFIKELHAMARYQGPDTASGLEKSGSLIVELKSIPLDPPQYPLYGKLQIDPPLAMAQALSP